MRREDVPYLAVVLNHILRHPDVLKVRKAVTPEIEKRIGAPTGTFLEGDFPQVDLLGMLYLVFLLPKETWKLSEKDPIFDDLRGKSIGVVSRSNTGESGSHVRHMNLCTGFETRWHMRTSS